MSFGERIRELREEEGLTQADFASLLHISKQQVSNYERDVHFPRDESVLRFIAIHFNVSMDYLIGIINVRNSSEVYQDFQLFNSLNEEHRKIVVKNMEFLKNLEERKTE